MSSRHEHQRISPQHADRFLSELLNLNWRPSRTKEEPPLEPEDEATFARLLIHPIFARMLPGLPSEKPAWRRLQLWRDKLRLGWIQRPRDRQEWMTSLVHVYAIVYAQEHESATPDELRAMLSESDRPVDLESAQEPFLQVLHRAREAADKMRRCPNPRCRQPYFLAERKTQQYCTNACAAPAKRRAKLAWWDRHKATELRKRRAARHRARRPPRQGAARRRNRERTARASTQRAPGKARKEKQR